MNNPDHSIPAYEYPTFPRQFVSYRWFKPLLVAALTAFFMLAFQIVLLIVATIVSGDLNFIDSIGEGYEDLDAYSVAGALINLGSLAVLLPALALAALIVRDRPYSSYTSSRGGWNWGGFFKCVGVAAAVMGALTVVSLFIPAEDNAPGIVQFTPLGFVACVILVPFQCLAEEYIFRGLILQAVASWTKLPAIGIVVSAIAFALGHPYNLTGMIAIFINGVVWGIVAWQTKGLEASSALHVVNNMVSFLLTGFGLEAATSEVDMVSLVIDIVQVGAFAAIVIVANRKYGWFKPKYDAAAAFNEKTLARRARRRRKNKAAQPESPAPAAPTAPFTPADVPAAAASPTVPAPADARVPDPSRGPGIPYPTTQVSRHDDDGI